MGHGQADAHFHALPERGRALVVPCVDDAAADMLACASVSLSRGQKKG